MGRWSRLVAARPSRGSPSAHVLAVHPPGSRSHPLSEGGKPAPLQGSRSDPLAKGCAAARFPRVAQRPALRGGKAAAFQGLRSSPLSEAAKPPLSKGRAATRSLHFANSHHG